MSKRGAHWLCVIAWVVLGRGPLHAQDGTSTTTTTSTSTTEQTAPYVDPGLSQVQLKLAAVNDERAHTNKLLPWLSVGVGVGSVLVGASVGAAKTLGCDAQCETPNWVTFAIVAGATVASLGAIWVLHREADIRELESQRYQLEQELLRIRLSRPAEAGPSARSTFSVRFAL